MPSPNRRHFLKTVAAAAALPAGFTAAEEAATAALPHRVLGRTGAKLPVLAYGGAALPRAWGNSLPTEARVALVRHAFDRGIRYFDTAGNYMESQAILGEALEPVRKDAFIVGKVETTDPAKVRAAVEKSIRELRTDYLDAILIHGTPGLEQMTVKRAMQVHAELVKLRDEKITKHIGLSAHGYFGKALALINSGGFDLCMLSVGYLPRGHNQIFSPRMLQLRDACVARAHELKMGLVAMKVIGAGMMGAWSGHLVPKFDKDRRPQLPAAAIRHVLDDKRFHLLCIGMRRRVDITENLATLTGDTTYTAEDKALLQEFGAVAMKCEAIRKMRVD
jgi:predicted aldo/keto reductase-like oxidoreductase